MLSMSLFWPIEIASATSVSQTRAFDHRVLCHPRCGRTYRLLLIDIPSTNVFEVNNFVFSIVGPAHVEDVGLEGFLLDSLDQLLVLVIGLTRRKESVV